MLCTTSSPSLVRTTSEEAFFTSVAWWPDCCSIQVSSFSFSSKKSKNVAKLSRKEIFSVIIGDSDDISIYPSYRVGNSFIFRAWSVENVTTSKQVKTDGINFWSVCALWRKKTRAYYL